MVVRLARHRSRTADADGTPLAHLLAVRFGALPKVERKVVTKLIDRSALTGFEHSPICTGEIGAMLKCFEAHGWRTAECLPQVTAMHECVELHKTDPVRRRRAVAAATPHRRRCRATLARASQDPRILAKRWQSNLRSHVLQWFAKQRLVGRR